MWKDSLEMLGAILAFIAFPFVVIGAAAAALVAVDRLVYKLHLNGGHGGGRC